MKNFRKISTLTFAFLLLHALTCSAVETPAETMARVVAEMRAVVASRSNATSNAATASAESADSGGPLAAGGFGPLGHGPMGQDSTNLLLAISSLGNGLLAFSFTNGASYGLYDLYYVNSLQAQNWQWRRVFTGAQADGAGNATFALHQPDPNQGFFILLDAADDDGDGLGNGYEAWFSYAGGRHTDPENPDTDNDEMRDGWEVEYGLDPTDNGSINVINGPSGNPDGDAYVNLAEFTNYNAFDGSFDPLKFYCTTNNRPIVFISGFDAFPFCQQATFTISRVAGCDADYSQPLTVYYSVGGSLSFDQGDYTLSPAPPEWPRIYSVVIPATNQSVTVTVTATNAVSNPSELETLNVSLTPHGVSPVPQVSDPTRWNYVVDWANNRATITYKYQPLADCVDVMTGAGTPVTIVLSGSDNCNDRLAFALVPGTGPTNGTLGAISQIDDTHANVTYTPFGGYAGPDGFQYTVSNPVRSPPAPVTVNVVTGAVVTTYCHTNQIAVHWAIPPWLPADYASGFKIFRCETNSGSCEPPAPPAAPYATVSDPSVRAYLDTGVTSGETYCYRVTFSHHSDSCPATNIYESPLSDISCNQLCPQPQVLISGNRSDTPGAAPGPPIETYDFTDGVLVHSFVPDGAKPPPQHGTPLGRGIAIYGGNIYYTELGFGFAPTDAIHVCPYGAAGSGGNDITNLPSPRPDAGIQDLAFHNGVLYALTGYRASAPVVYKLDPATGTNIGPGIAISGPASPDSDGFTVLTNGNFLINDFDGGDGTLQNRDPYREYDGTTGLLVPGGLVIDLGDFGFATGTGVATAPDGQSLYFIANINDPSGQTLVHTDPAGHLLGTQKISDHDIEDIEVVVH